MDTPICDFVAEYAGSGALRLHMPGHKGARFLGFEAQDITEITGADVLYSADGIIRRSMDNAAALFGTAKTLYSTEGSSLSIRAMLYLALLHGKGIGRRPVVAAGRNAHKAFVSAAALLDLEVNWLYPGQRSSLIGCEITPSELEAALAAMQDKPIAVYITSPDYLGNIADIAGISAVCRKYGTLLLVDNAHGAYLRFLNPSQHPMDLGADLCCDSAHKTLPVLTGGGYLHVSYCAPRLCCEQAECAMTLFASTSPSYLVLQSLDAANKYLSEGYSDKLAIFAERAAALRNSLARRGYILQGAELLKLTIAAKAYGYTGSELAELLRLQGIEAEFSDPDYLVMMLTPEIDELGLERLKTALEGIEMLPAIETLAALPKPAEAALSIRQARFSLSEVIDIRCANGRILAEENVSCPPAIPILVCGERIDGSAIECFNYYSINKCRVVIE